MYCMVGVSVGSLGCDILGAGACISICIVGVLALGLSICMVYRHCLCPYEYLYCMDSDNIGVLIPTSSTQVSVLVYVLYWCFGGGVLRIYYSICTGRFCISLCIV